MGLRIRRDFFPSVEFVIKRGLVVSLDHERGYRGGIAYPLEGSWQVPGHPHAGGPKKDSRCPVFHRATGAQMADGPQARSSTISYLRIIFRMLISA